MSSVWQEVSRLEVRPLRLGFRNLIFASGNRGRPSHRLEAGLTIKQNCLRFARELQSEKFSRLEAGAGIEPANSGFADRDLTTWLPRQIARSKLTGAACTCQRGGDYLVTLDR
jgi:NOL1/NOP2/fmu family ribosome biogenesis protein